MRSFHLPFHLSFYLPFDLPFYLSIGRRLLKSEFCPILYLLIFIRSTHICFRVTFSSENLSLFEFIWAFHFFTGFLRVCPCLANWYEIEFPLHARRLPTGRGEATDALDCTDGLRNRRCLAIGVALDARLAVCQNRIDHFCKREVAANQDLVALSRFGRFDSDLESRLSILDPSSSIISAPLSVNYFENK